MKKETQTHNLSITIDIKQRRIRFFKSTLRCIGNPHYIQLLVNLDSQKIAIRSIEKESTDEQTIKINLERFKADDSCEVSSLTLVKKLCDAMKITDLNYSYRLSGQFVPSHNLIIFPFSTLSKIDKEISHEQSQTNN